jgi:hypothetical protein
MVTMTDEKQDRKQFTDEIKGRDIVFNWPTEGQFAMLVRFANAATRASSTAGNIDAVARMLDVMMAMIDSPDDRNFVEDGLISSEITLQDMMAPWETMVEMNEEKPKAPRNGPVKTAARGRR